MQNNTTNKDEHRINERIRGVKEVRLVGDNVTMGIYPIEEAMRIAEELELDLVEISATAVPPVCKVMDYQKFCYQQKKKAKEAKANAAKVVVKEIRFGPQTDDHDYEFKLRHAKEFLQEGSKVKAYVFFKGRSILFKEQGEVLLLRFAQDLEEYGKVESMPVLEGKRMTMFIAPKKTAPKKTTAPVIDDDDDDDDELDDAIADVQEAARKKPQQKAPKEYTGPKVEGENWDD
jgi:translation initiation factor IF-3